MGGTAVERRCVSCQTPIPGPRYLANRRGEPLCKTCHVRRAKVHEFRRRCWKSLQHGAVYVGWTLLTVSLLGGVYLFLNRSVAPPVEDGALHGHPSEQLLARIDSPASANSACSNAAPDRAPAGP